MNEFQNYMSTTNNRHDVLNQIFKWFGVMWLLTGIGLFVGELIPDIFIVPISILTLVILIVTMFMKKSKKLGIGVGLVVSFLMGITLNVTVSSYAGALGNSVVLAVFGATAVTFFLTGLIGYRTRKDLSNWGTILFVVLIALVVFGLISIFVPFSSTITLIVSAIGVVLFSLYNVYEMNLIAKGRVNEEDVGIMALNLYLNFINIFLYLLRLVSSLSR